MAQIKELQAKVDELEASLAAQTEHYSAEAKLAMKLEDEVEKLREQEEQTRF